MSALVLGVLATVLGVLLTVSLVALVLISVFALRYARMVFAWEENINTSLDVLDNAYEKLSTIRQKPLFVDTPEVRQMMDEVDNCRQAVLWVQNALTMPAKPRVVVEGETQVTD